MNIKELQAKQGNILLEKCKVVEISEIRTFQKFGQPGRVANALIEDGSGQITLTLWNEQIDLFKAGDHLRIIDGFVNEWQGRLQITSGRRGRIEKH